MKKIKIMDTTLRDAHQSLMATRLRIDEMLPILEEIDNIGYHALEVWGGATFDSCLRYLNEDPWERLRTIRKHVKNTKLQMLLRGQNILGYKHYPDDVVRAFVRKSVENGIDVIRIFDALNDPRNIKTAVDETKKAGAHAQTAISYTTSPIHTVDAYVELAKQYRDMGADSICIKDMTGLLKPYVAEELISKIKSEVKLPLQLHSHCTSGLASMMYVKAVESGIDIIDTAISPLSLGTSQPPVESIVATLEGTPYDTGLSLEKLSKIADHFQPIREKYIANGLINQKVLQVNINTLRYQIPGGMLSNLIAQLKAQGAEDKLTEVLNEVPRVRKDMGYPPLVTPSSQIVGTQSVLNVMSGERYKMIPNEIKELVRGNYGKTTQPISDEMVKKIIGDEKPITCRPADKLEPMMETYKKELGEYMECEEDVLSYAVFPNLAIDYFKKRQAKKYKLDNENSDKENKVHYV